MFWLLVSMCMASKTPAGHIPDDELWSLPTNACADLEVLNTIQEKRNDGTARMCFLCTKFKPDRTHHCRMCDTCVLRMDHHCPWIANCIGFRNYKYFFLTLLYSEFALGIYVGLFWETVVIMMNDEEVSGYLAFFVLLQYSLMCLLLIIVTIFWVFHWYLLLNGYTTIEFCEKRARKANYRNGSPYSIGLLYNVKQGLGANPLLWFFPVGYSHDEETGVNFKTRPT